MYVEVNILGIFNIHKASLNFKGGKSERLYFTITN